MAAVGAVPLSATPAFEGLTVLERGWLSCNNVLLHGDGDGATLVDSSHANHAGQTVALLRHALQAAGGEPLRQVVNTHLHSDHCGGNAALQQAFGARVVIPPGLWDAVAAWDTEALGYAPTHQRCPRFGADARLSPGEVLRVGRRRWDVLAAPGHDPHSLILFDADAGLLISADALWADGFGVVFPELDGEAAFDEVAAVFDLIERLPVRHVIPGHGAPFDDVAGALQRARSRLAFWRAEPQRHAHHAAKVLLKYHLMEEGSQPWPALLAWCAATPLLLRLHLRLAAHEAHAAWCERLVAELARAGALAVADGVVHDR